jgi:hypothetical protein
MKSVMILVIVAASQVSSLPLGNNVGRDLTDGFLNGVSGDSLGLPGDDLFSGLLDGTVLGESEDTTSAILEDVLDPSTFGLFKREPLGDLTDLLGEASGASPGLPGITDEDLFSPLIDSTLDGTDLDILGSDSDATSLVGDLLDPNTLDLGLFKRKPNEQPTIGSLTNLGVNSASHLDVVDVLLQGDALAKLGYPHLGQGLVRRLLTDALVKRDILSNGIGGQLGTGVIGLAGDLQHIGKQLSVSHGPSTHYLCIRWGRHRGRWSRSKRTYWSRPGWTSWCRGSGRS